ncbi:hypothetical protein E1281_21245 [Actinomadura sp. KC345]|uniref:hypothetical protein n=1 Tax=Actinomadura sp. KC345 TaxID=2530371 RepID=UPI00104CB4EA|nr:hypothetical protein [Actinomadura sp. KC345]TDC51007.1 hypothetical protein E1281_21245 [Actinomadura sp. KC345]
MTLIGFGRAFAVLISVTTFVFLFVNDSWRGDNLFLVPDLILCALLLVAAALPAPYAAPAMGLTLAMCTGVFTASVSSYAVRGELGTASLLGVVGCAAMAVLLQRHHFGKGGRTAPRSQEAPRGTV